MFAKLIVTGILAFQAAATNNEWIRTEKADALSGVHYSQFELTGHYLEAPRTNSDTAPKLELRCIAGKHRYGSHGYLAGSRASSYLATGTTLERRDGSVPVEFRLDDGKIQQESWSISGDGSSAFFSDATLNTLIYGHFMPHKENTNAPIRKLVIALDEAFANRIVMQFDMPDPTDVADVCGITLHKK